MPALGSQFQPSTYLDMTAVEIIYKVQQLVDGDNNHDKVAVIDLYDDNAIVEDPVDTDPKSGHEAIKAFYQQGFQVKNPV